MSVLIDSYTSKNGNETYDRSQSFIGAVKDNYLSYLVVIEMVQFSYG